VRRLFLALVRPISRRRICRLLNASRWCDILRAVNGEGTKLPQAAGHHPTTARLPAAAWRLVWELTFAHRRVQRVPRPRYSYPVRDSEVPCCFVSASSPLPQGDTLRESSRNPEIVQLSQHGGGRAASVGCADVANGKKPPTLTRFTPGLKAGILSLSEDSPTQMRAGVALHAQS